MMTMTKQATPFHLLAKARTISLKDVFTMGEEAAHQLFCQMRWPETNGAAVCPKCGHDQTYTLKKRRQHECKACKRQFSVTSETIFASRKLSFTDLLAAIVIVANAHKGISAMQLSRDLDHQHKSMWVLVHKIREAMAAETAQETLSGVVEVDGAWFGGHVKPENMKEDRVDRRKLENQNGKRRAVVVSRERGGRTLTSVHDHEADGVEAVAGRIEDGSEVHADEASHWDGLEVRFPTKRVNHSEGYVINGVSTNQAESYFSRLRRMIRGQHHHVSARYLAAYAAHAAFLEDHRSSDNGKQARRIVGLGLSHPVSRQWKGYWQRADHNAS